MGAVLLLFPVISAYRSITKPDVLETVAPGFAVFKIEEPGTYTVWRQVVGTIDDEFRVEEDALPPGLTISILRSTDGTTVPIEMSTGFRESVNGNTKMGLISANLAPGSYKLISSTNGEMIKLVVSESKVSLGGFLRGVGIGLLGALMFFGGVIFAIVVTIRDSLKPSQPRQL